MTNVGHKREKQKHMAVAFFHTLKWSLNQESAQKMAQQDVQSVRVFLGQPSFIWPGKRTT